MPRLRSRILAPVATACLSMALAGCAAVPARDALVPGTQATFEGTVRSVDTDPWAYDGNAVVRVGTATSGEVAVQLPARWNLCKAPPVEGVQALAAGDRVRVTGSVDAPGQVTVCTRADHRLVRLP